MAQIRIGQIVRNETPRGVVDWSNTVFTLAGVPAEDTLEVFLDGQLMLPGVDYTLTGQVVTFTTAPATFNGYTQKVRANYLVR